MFLFVFVVILLVCLCLFAFHFCFFVGVRSSVFKSTRYVLSRLKNLCNKCKASFMSGSKKDMCQIRAASFILRKAPKRKQLDVPWKHLRVAVSTLNYQSKRGNEVSTRIFNRNRQAKACLGENLCRNCSQFTQQCRSETRLQTQEKIPLHECSQQDY